MTVAAFVCPRGHRVIVSTGAEYTVREVEPGLYAYVYGRCADLERCDNLAAAAPPTQHQPQPQEAAD